MIYFVMLFITVFFALLYKKNENKKIFAFLSFIPFFMISAIRYDVGTDYLYRYVPNYISIANGKNVTSLEILFNLLIRVCAFITKDYLLLFIITSAIIVGLVFKKIYNDSKIVILSIIIFFIGSFFFQSMNLVRQYISISIIFSSYKLMLSTEKRDNILWFCLMIVASLFHTISLAFIPIFLFRKKEIKLKSLAICLIILILFGKVIPEVIIETVKILGVNKFANFEKYEHYLLYGGNLSYLTLISEIIIYIYIYIMYNKMKESDKYKDEKVFATFYLNCQSFVLMYTIMNIHIELFFRFAALFTIFQVLSIPYFYYFNNNKSIKFFKFKIKNGTNLLMLVVIFAMSFRLIYSNFICGAEEVIPYKTIFIKERV